MEVKIIEEDPTKYKRYPKLVEIEIICNHCKRSLGIHQIHVSRKSGIPKYGDLPEEVFAQSGCLENNNLAFWCLDCGQLIPRPWMRK